MMFTKALILVSGVTYAFAAGVASGVQDYTNCGKNCEKQQIAFFKEWETNAFTDESKACTLATPFLDCCKKENKDDGIFREFVLAEYTGKCTPTSTKSRRATSEEATEVENEGHKKPGLLQRGMNFIKKFKAIK
eukprot:Pgem_evm1s19925